MEKKLSKRKMLSRKAAALAGVTIMAGASLHGIALPKASAAENPSTSPPAITDQTTQTKKDVKKPLPETDVSAADPSAKQNQLDKDKGRGNDSDKDRDKDKRDDRYRHEKWFDRDKPFAHRMRWYNDSHNKINIYIDNASAVNIVMAAAPNLGFDAYNDTFTLISHSGSQSVVRVDHNGVSYNITVDRLANGNWLVSSVNLIQ